MGNTTQKEHKTERPCTKYHSSLVNINSASSIAIDPITGGIFAIKAVPAACCVGEYSYDRLFVFSPNGKQCYNTKIVYPGFKTVASGFYARSSIFGAHGISIHQNMIFITNRTMSIIALYTFDAELISLFEMSPVESNYSIYHHVHGIGFSQDARGSGRTAVDEDGIFVCRHHLVLALMHDMKPGYFEIVPKNNGHILDILTGKEKIHVLFEQESNLSISVLSKSGMCLSKQVIKKHIVSPFSFTLAGNGKYFIHGGRSIIYSWDGEYFGDSEIKCDELPYSCRGEDDTAIACDINQKLVWCKMYVFGRFAIQIQDTF